MKLSLFLTVLFISTILQIAFFSQFTILGAKYEMLFALTIFISLRYNWYEGAICGIWCGLFNDIFSLGSLGVGSFIYGISGFIAAISKNFIFTQHISIKLMILFIMSFISSILYIIFIQGIDIIFDLWTIYKLKITSIALINTFFSAIFYKILNNITKSDGLQN